MIRRWHSQDKSSVDYPMVTQGVLVLAVFVTTAQVNSGCTVWWTK
jgi:hypothetical protein